MDKRIKLEYKWIIIGLCFLMVLVCLGFCSSSKGLYLSPMTEALEIKRSAFSIGDSIRYISTAIVNMFFGILVSKFGTKKLICAGIVSLIVSTLIYSFASQLYWFYIAGAFLGVGFSWTTTTMVGTVVNRWCSEKKGTIMGAVLASNGIGAAVAAQILTPIIYQEGNKFGYRDAYILTSVILLIVLVLIAVFFKDKTGTMLKSDVNHKKTKTHDWVGVDISTAKRNVYFYLTIICIFCTGMVLQGVTGIGMAHIKDVGISSALLATIASVHSLSLALSKFLAGVSYDKLGLKITAVICNASAVMAMVALAFVSDSHSGVILAFVYSVISSMALPLETIMLPIFAGDLFGHKSYEQILGIFVSVNTAGYAVGVPLMNFVYDIVGTYKPVLLIFAVLMVIILSVFQIVLNASKKWKTI